MPNNCTGLAQKVDGHAKKVYGTSSQDDTSGARDTDHGRNPGIREDSEAQTATGRGWGVGRAKIMARFVNKITCWTMLRSTVFSSGAIAPIKEHAGRCVAKGSTGPCGMRAKLKHKTNLLARASLGFGSKGAREIGRAHV